MTPVVSASPAVTSASTLAMKTAITLVLDEAIDPARDRPGRAVKAHLRDGLSVGATELAPPGTIVRLRVEGLRRKPVTTEGVEDVATDGIPILGGSLPVRAVAPIGASATGATLVMVTLATVDASDPAHIQIQIPLPVRLSTDRPYGEFTPIPLKTPTPVIRPTARPSPTPVPTATPAATPAETAQPTATPTP